MQSRGGDDVELSAKAIAALKMEFAGRVEADRPVLRELARAGLIEKRSDGTRTWGTVTAAGWELLGRLRSS